MPFYLWWQGELHEPVDPQLFSWVDRLIYDSAEWRSFDAQLRLIEAAQEESNQRLVLCDLNWMRLVQFRLAIAQFFDTRAGCEQLTNVQRIEIVHAASNRSTAMLLAGWLAAQLGWTLIEAADERMLSFSDCSGQGIRVVFEEQTGEPISRCSLFCRELEFRVSQRAGSDLLDVAVRCDGEDRTPELMPGGCNDPVALLNEELVRGGPHRVYLRAIEAVREVF